MEDKVIDKMVLEGITFTQYEREDGTTFGGRRILNYRNISVL